MPRCKAPEILRNEAYLEVRLNDEGGGKRSRRAFFSSLKLKDDMGGMESGEIRNGDRYHEVQRMSQLFFGVPG